jgi:hypothetical protein
VARVAPLAADKALEVRHAAATALEAVHRRVDSSVLLAHGAALLPSERVRRGRRSAQEQSAFLGVF